MPKRKLKIIKVPLDKEPSLILPSFPQYPRLYLELLENKSKVKSDLKHTEYVPNYTNNLQYPSHVELKTETRSELSKELEDLKIDFEKDYRSDRSHKPSKDDKVKKSLTSKQKKPLKMIDMSDANNPTSYDADTNYMKIDGDPSKEDYSSRASATHGVKGDKRDSNINSSISNKDDDVIGVSKEYSNRSRDDKYKSRFEKYLKTDDEKKDERYDDISKDDNIKEESTKESDSATYGAKGDKAHEQSDRSESKKKTDGLSKLLRGELEDISPVTSSNFSPSPQSYNPPSQSPVINANRNLPPSIAELQSGNVIQDTVRDLSIPSKTDELEMSKKREYLYKFRQLKKSYPIAKIPDYTEYTDIRVLEREYDTIVRELNINSSVENYKRYLNMAFMGLEYALVTFLKFEDIKGFAVEQASSINQYESILMEIGEKNYLQDNKKWPAELRLLGIVFMNAAMFIGIRMFYKKSGINLSAQPRPPPPQGEYRGPPPQQAPRKMRGPDIDLDDFDMDLKKNN